MALRLRVMVPNEYTKDGVKRTSWTKIGIAFPRDDGGYKVVLDALPIGRDIVMFPDDGQGPTRRPEASSDEPPHKTTGDIPF